MRKLIVASMSLALVAGGLVLSTTLATNASAATCTGTVQIDSMTWNPPTVTPGQSSSVTVVAENCTSQPVQAILISYASFVDASGKIPPGCIVYDPFERQLAIPANGQASVSITYSTFANCTAIGLQDTADITLSNGGPTVASQTATLTITGASTAPTTCAVSYTRTSEWQGGVVAQVTITNTGTTTIPGWTLDFTFPGDQKITNAWGAAVTQTGTAVSATNAPYDATVAPAASVSFGFQGTWQTSDANPTAFQLNKALCTTR